jgi:hypothetical protein
MPGFLFHVGAIMNCAHPPGLATIPAPTQARVFVSGQPVAVKPDRFVVQFCQLTGTPTPPCTSVQWSGFATKVTVQGQPVLLQPTPSGTGNGICIGPPAPPPFPTVVAMQQRVTGI